MSVHLTDNEVVELLNHMALDSEGFQVRQIAVMEDPRDLRFEDDDTGEAFDRDTVARIYDHARSSRPYHCHVCGEDKHITEWDVDSHGVDMCSSCYLLAGLENEHADGMHEDKPNFHCPSCQPPRSVA